MNHSSMNISASGASVKPKKSKIPLLVFRTSPMDISSIKSMDFSGRKSVSSIESNGRLSRIPILVKETSRKEGLERKTIIPAKVTDQKSPNKKSIIPMAINGKVVLNNFEIQSSKDNHKSKTLSNSDTKATKFDEEKMIPTTGREEVIREGNTTDKTPTTEYTAMSATGSRGIVSLDEIEIYSADDHNWVDMERKVGNEIFFSCEEKMKRKIGRSKIPIFMALRTPRSEVVEIFVKTCNRNVKEIRDPVPKKKINSAMKSRIPIATNRQMSMHKKDTFIKNGAALEFNQQNAEASSGEQSDVLPRSGLRKRLGRAWKSIKRIFTCKCCRGSGEKEGENGES